MARKKIKNTKGKRLTQPQLHKAISKLFTRHNSKRLNAKQVQQKLKLNNSADSISAALEFLAENDIIRHIKDGKYKFQSQEAPAFAEELHEGLVDMTKSGSAYIIVDGLSSDIFVPPKKMQNALDNDMVQVSVKKRYGDKIQGEIVKVIKRNTNQFIGRFEKLKNYGFVIPKEQKIPFDIFIHPNNQMGAEDLDTVLVEVVRWTDKKDNPEGKILQILNEVDEKDLTMKSILLQQGFKVIFPDNVLHEANGLKLDTSKQALKNRKDLREITTFTIDPENAKDFDDALSIRRINESDWEIGVHIADVTHYLKENSALDKEAYDRSTSVYLVDRVAPMLPEVLSNELCSLRPNEDTLTFSAIFTFDERYELKDTWLGKTIIHSDRRFTYEEAQEVLETGEGDYASELRWLNQIAQKIRSKRFKNGSIAFESPELYFKLDENNLPTAVIKKARKDAHLLIEDFMLLANKVVAEFFGKHEGPEYPFVYRTHDSPDPQRLHDFSIFAKEMGFQTDFSSPRKIVKTLNKLSKQARTNAVLEILEVLAIRTMAKAEYHTENIGHFGLGFEYYTHFTSPIRRYSDVLVHRLLQQKLMGKKRSDKELLSEKCKHISSQERKAQDAERSSIKYMQVKYMSTFVGESFDGIINGIIDRGFFVELVENYSEGMVGFDTLNEYFTIDHNYLKAIGKESKKVIKVGDRVTVKVKHVDLDKRQIEFDLVTFH